MITTPTININGTSARALLEQHLTAIEALRAAITKVQEAAPNGRDYQTAPANSFSHAQQEHRRRLSRLEDVIDELEQIAEYIVEFAR